MASQPDQQQGSEATPNADTDFSAAFKEAVAPADADKVSAKEPAEEARSSEAPPEGAAEGSTSGEVKTFDPWGGLSPEQKAYFERVANSERSQRGRVGALTKKLQNLESARAAPAAQAPEGTGSDEKEATASDLQAKLDHVVEEYGDVVGPIVEVLKEVQAKIDTIAKPATERSEVDADAETLTEAYGALERDHPDYAEVAADQSFLGWLGSQPEKVVALANSFDPAEVSLVLTKFKAERSAHRAAQPGDGDDQGQQGSTATDDKRRRQLEGSRAVTPRGAPAAAGVPNDFSSAFKARAAQYAR